MPTVQRHGKSVYKHLSVYDGRNGGRVYYVHFWLLLPDESEARHVTELLATHCETGGRRIDPFYDRARGLVMRDYFVPLRGSARYDVRSVAVQDCVVYSKPSKKRGSRTVLYVLPKRGSDDYCTKQYKSRKEAIQQFERIESASLSRGARLQLTFMVDKKP